MPKDTKPYRDPPAGRTPPPELLRTFILRLARGPVWARISVPAFFGLGLALRILLAVAARPVLVSDAHDYYVLAENLAAGRGYTQTYDGSTVTFRGFTFRAFRSPGYPAFLAALYSAFGWRPAVYLAANIVADLVTQACFLFTAVRLLGLGAAVFVQALLALHVLWTPNQMTESLFTALLAGLALLLVYRMPLRRWPGALGFGLLAVAAVFVRPIGVCVFPALLWLWWQDESRPVTKPTPVPPHGTEPGHPRPGPGATRPGKKQPGRARSDWLPRGLSLLVLAGLPTALGLSVWAARNYRLFGVPVFFTTNSGHHNAADYDIPADFAYGKLRAAGLNEAQINAAFLASERQIARENPGWWLGKVAKRGAELFSLKPAWELENSLWTTILPADGPDGSFAGRLYRWSYYQYYLTYPLAACGALFALGKRRSLGGLGLLLFAFIVIHACVSAGNVRLAAPIYPFMCLLAGALVGRRTGQSDVEFNPHGP